MIRLKISSMGCLMGLFLLGTACSSSEESALDGGGTGGSVTISISAVADFGATTKVVNESDYQDVDNYTVQILNSTGSVATDVQGTACVYTGATIPSSIELKNGTYTAKAFYGTEHDFSVDEFYVEGSQLFNINGADLTAPIEISCGPTCGKVSAEFDETMADYFSAYNVVYSTASSGSSFTWENTQTAPCYVKVDAAGEEVTATINFTRLSDSKQATVEKTYTLQRNKAWKLYIVPDASCGDLGISITLDQSVNEQDIEIVVPAEWI